MERDLQNMYDAPESINSCPEFPYFGASYPDATCIDGYLWDLDSSENGGLTIGGDEPCPFCNTEKFIEQHEDEENTRDLLLAHIESLKQIYDKQKGE